MAALVSLAVAAPMAQAAYKVMAFQDDDVDWLLREDANGVLQKATGAFQEGDVLVSVFEFPTYTIDGVSQLSATQELTGIAVVQIDSISGNTITLKQYAGGFNAVSPVDVTNGNAGEGATIAMWINSTTGAGGDTDLVLDAALNPAVSCTSLDNCLEQASLGTLLQVDGFAGDPDEFWTSTGLVAGAFDTNTVLALGPTVNVALFNAGQTTFYNATGPITFINPLTQLPCADTTDCVAGPAISGTIQGGGGTTPLNAGIVADGAFARSDTDATKLMQVPEPGTLALVGLSLLGLAGSARRVRK
jgi:hypothetical protein